MIMSWLERRLPETRKPYYAPPEGDIDYGRVVHSASFRRLQGKTQILNLGDSDFYRTWLTHSLEVAQIAGGIVKQLRFNDPDHPAPASLNESPLRHRGRRRPVPALLRHAGWRSSRSARGNWKSEVQRPTKFATSRNLTDSKITALTARQARTAGTSAIRVV